MSGTQLRVDADRLHRCYQDVFQAVGVPADDARVVANTLLFADVRAIDTHGAARLPVYVERIEGGGTRPVTEFAVLADHGAIVTLDAGDGLGQVAASKAMGLALDRAAKHGIAITTVKRSNHLGVLAYYAEMALEHDMIGLAVSGVASTLAAFGGSSPVLGSNPWAIAVPGREHGPLVVDMAQGVTITPHLRSAIAAGEDIPEGWAVDESGAPTTDPAAALMGAILPFGGHKGYALTLALEVLGSILPGAAFSTDIPDYQSGVTTPKRLGHLFLSLRIDRFMETSDFEARVDDLLARVKGSGRPGVVRVPGERGRRAEQERRRDGVPVSAPVAASIAALSRRLGVVDPFAGS